MEKNAFKDLEMELMSNRDSQFNLIQNNLVHTKNLFETIGDFIELYLPKVFEVLVKLTGGNDEVMKKESKYPHES